MIRAILVLCCLSLPTGLFAQDAPPGEPAMTPERLLAIVVALDPEAQPTVNGAQLTVQDVPVLIIIDPTADRMRAMVPIRNADDLTPEDLMRVLQANFDTALDARYAVANGRLWGTFIHPLSPLERDELISGIGQTVNLALTYGTLFSGGAMSFGRGDSAPLQRELIDRLLERGQDI